MTIVALDESLSAEDQDAWWDYAETLPEEILVERFWEWLQALRYFGKMDENKMLTPKEFKDDVGAFGLAYIKSEGRLQNYETGESFADRRLSGGRKWFGRRCTDLGFSLRRRWFRIRRRIYGE